MNKIYINIDKNFSYNKEKLEKFNLQTDSEINIRFISDFRSSKILRNFITIISEKIKIDNIWKSRLILISDELINNSIEYWSQKWEVNIFKILIKPKWKNKLLLNLEITDSWNWTEAKTAKEMILIRNKKKLNWFFKNNWIRGRWLFMIIEKLVDRLYFKDSENWWLTVWIEKKLEIKKD